MVASNVRFTLKAGYLLNGIGGRGHAPARPIFDDLAGGNPPATGLFQLRPTLVSSAIETRALS